MISRNATNVKIVHRKPIWIHYLNTPTKNFEFEPFKKVKKNDNEARPVSIIYATNGSGKSTISRNIDICTENPVTPEETISHLDSPRVLNPIWSENLSTEELQRVENVFVFNEDFVSKYVYTPNDLESIVLIGEQAEHQREIEKKQEEIQKTEDEKQTRQQERRTTESKRIRARDQLKKRVSEPLHADTDLTISYVWQLCKNLNSFQLNHKVITQLRKAAKNENIHTINTSELVTQLKEQIENLKHLRQFETIQWRPGRIMSISEIEEITQFLSSEPEQDADNLSSQLSKRLLDMKKSADELQSDLTLADPEHDYCPKCLQTLSPEYKTQLKQVIVSVLQIYSNNERARQAQKLIVEQFGGFDFQRPPTLSSAEYDDANRAADHYNEQIGALNDAIASVVNQPFSTVEFDSAQLTNAARILAETTDEIQTAINQHNKQGNKEHKTVERIIEDSFLLFYHRNATVVDKFLQHSDRAAEIDAGITELERECSQLSAELSRQMKRLGSTSIALTEINRLLSIVFAFSKMRLEATDKGYQVKIGGEKVAPNHLSTGERNILGLCYFLLAINQGLSIEQSNGNERVIIFDDPISSFDNSNKYGVLCLLKWFLAKNFIGRGSSSERPSRTKVIFFTHDQNVAAHLWQICSSKTFSSGYGSNMYVSFHFDGTELKESKFEEFDQYSLVLREIYDFAFLEDAPAPAANDIRQVIEAFTIFQLGSTTSQFESTKLISESLVLDDTISNFLESFAARAIVHSDSHSAMKIRTYDFGCNDEFSDLDYKRFCFDFCRFVFLVAPTHIPLRIGKSDEDGKEIYQKLSSAFD